jgi:Tol biopolymer transport system component
LAIAGGLLSALAPIAAISAPTPLTIRTSISSTGEEGNASSSGGPVSVDGRFVAFDSSASNLVSGDNNEVQDVFLRNLKTGLTQRVSLGGAGNESNGSSSVLALSNNGRFVTFLSEASNLVAGDNNGVADIFVCDLKKAQTQRVFVNYAGGQGNTTSGGFSVSANGRFVAFTSNASNLVEGDNNQANDVFVRDLKTGITRRASVDSAGVEGNGESGSYYYRPSFSANGRFVAYVSNASNLVPGDTNGYQDVFVHDLKTGATQRVSVNSAGEEASGAGFDPFSNCGGGSYPLDSDSPSISAGGRFVAFVSTACNLVEDDNNADFVYGGTDVFVHDLKTGETKIASVDNSGDQFTFNYDPVISANGRFVAFTSSYGGELSLLYYITSNIAVHDLKTGETKLASIDPVAGDYYYFGSGRPRISDTGRFVSFSSDSSNLVPGDNNGGASGYGVNDAFVSRMW